MNLSNESLLNPIIRTLLGVGVVKENCGARGESF